MHLKKFTVVLVDFPITDKRRGVSSMCVSSPTWAVDEGPVVLGLSAAGTHTGVESRLAGCSRHARLGGWRRHSSLEGSAV